MDKIALFVCGHIEISRVNGKPLYLFRCATHGIQTSFSHGYKEYLACKECDIKKAEDQIDGEAALTL